MTTINPRWEWRTFGVDSRTAEAAFASHKPLATHDSEELYLLTQHGPNVKVRDDLLDIKVLQEVDAVGLERWAPVLKAEFPLSGADLADVLEALAVEQPANGANTFSLRQLLEEIAFSGAAVRPVRVRKHRVRYMVSGCMAECSDVVVAGRRTRTVAVESEDGAAVVAAVDDLGFGGYSNLNYQIGLAMALDDVLPVYGVVDVGTNSVKFHLGERGGDGSWRTLVDRAEVTRLGEDLEERSIIASAALGRTAEAIGRMVDEAKRHHAIAVAAVGTAGLRIARNSDEVVQSVRSQTGLPIEVISGEEEGRLAYLAACAGLGLKGGSVVAVDSGGGSSQFTFGEGSRVDEQFSVNVGAVKYTERFGLAGEVSEVVLAETLEAISSDLAAIEGRGMPDALVGMGGTLTNITAVHYELADYDPAVVQGTALDRSEVERQIELYRSMDTAKRRSIVGLQPKRADVILAGALIVRTVMDKLQHETLLVSDRGLRHGLIVERFGSL